MYSTRPLSLYKTSLDAISLPPEGPNSSYLVLQDEESTQTCCFGLCKNRAIDDPPFPQNKLLSIEYHIEGDEGFTYNTYDAVYLIPVINQPLSSNQYYMIKADGKHKGETYASSRDEDMGTCFCCKYVKDVKSRPFDPEDLYQQFEFSSVETCTNCKKLVAKSVAPDGHPPRFLRRDGWVMNARTPRNFNLGEAYGLNPTLRAHLPDFSSPPSKEFSKSVVVGKWYIPFMFVKEGTEKERIRRSVFYEMMLEQRWEHIFARGNNYGQAKAVEIDTMVSTEVVRVSGKEAVQGERNDDKGVVWFRTINGNRVEEQLGLSTLVVERMMWEQERAGWVAGKEKQGLLKMRNMEELQGGEVSAFMCGLRVSF